MVISSITYAFGENRFHISFKVKGERPPPRHETRRTRQNDLFKFGFQTGRAENIVQVTSLNQISRADKFRFRRET
jgi:hypothetical protein